MDFRLQRAATSLPVHLNEAKLHLRLAVDEASAPAYSREDSLLMGMISAATGIAEAETWRSLVLQTWDLFLYAWPAGNEIILPRPPLRKVVSVQYTQEDGTPAEIPPSGYAVDTGRVCGRIVLSRSAPWPTASLSSVMPVRIRYKCGYAVPFTVDLAANALLVPDHPFIDGEEVRLSVSGGMLPGGLQPQTDYFITVVDSGAVQLATSMGGEPVIITDTGSGAVFLGEVPANILIGIKLLITDFYKERGETVRVGMYGKPMPIPRAASHHFNTESVRRL